MGRGTLELCEVQIIAAQPSTWSGGQAHNYKSGRGYACVGSVFLKSYKVFFIPNILILHNVLNQLLFPSFRG